MVVINNHSKQAVTVSVVNDSGIVEPYKLMPGTWTPRYRYDQVTQQTHQLAAAGHVALRSV